MSRSRLVLLTAGVGLVSFVLLALDLGPAGELMALVQIGALAGAPLAALLHPEVRSWPTVSVLAVATSLALTALAAQSMIWFDLSGRAILVLVTTVYGLALGWLISASRLGRNEGTVPNEGDGR